MPGKRANCDVVVNLRHSFREIFHGRAGAEKISVAVNIVDARDGGPEFVFARPRRGEGGLLT